MKSNYEHTLTSICSLNNIYPCIQYKGDYWNGWMVPYVTTKVRDKIIEEFRQLGRDNGTEEEYEDIIEDYLLDDPTTIEGVEYVNIGYGLCWEHVEDWEIDKHGNKIIS